MRAHKFARHAVGVVPAVLIGDVFLVGSECVFPVMPEMVQHIALHQALQLHGRIKWVAPCLLAPSGPKNLLLH